MRDDLGIRKSSKQRIVIVGGGFAGLKLAKKLSKKKYQVVLLDRNNYHTFQPLLYQVAMGELEPDSIAYPLRKSIHGSSLVFRMADVLRINPEDQTLNTSQGKLKFDQLIIASGSKANYFGNDNIAKYAFSLKSIPGALDIRSWIFQSLESAVLENKAEASINIVIVGGGPTGVEIAGALSDLKNHVLPKDYQELSFSRFKIYIIEGSKKILNAMSNEASVHSRRYLEKMGVEIKTGHLVKDFDGARVLLSTGEMIPTNILIWSAGVTGNPVEGIAESSVHRNMRYKVDRYNRILGYENIYAVGDVASMEDPFEKNHPMLAPVAIQQATNLARNLNIRSAKPWKKFRYSNKGVLATVGRNKALADFGALHLRGFFAWLIWVFVHLMTLVGFRNRLIVFINWLISYISFDSAIHLIIRPLKIKPIEGNNTAVKKDYVST
ncbi:MAG: NAD(P)/FAD-dependent oxidoreductase [Bacteroidota bacterium]